MKHLNIFLLVIFVITSPVFSQLKWTFDEESPLLSTKGFILMNLHTVKEVPEFVKGIKGNGLRTDGYSTWLDVKLPEKINSISGWFALESFPTDTAAFIGIKDIHKNISLTICVDRFGELLAGVSKGNNYSYSSLTRYIDRFKWNNIALSFKEKSLIVYLNGKEIDSLPVKDFSVGDNNLISIGKNFKNKKVGIYDVTAINGLIDEIELNHNESDFRQLLKEAQILSSQIPFLAIPEIRFAKDFNRPHYHLLPAANWTNETHGLIYYKGKYHIFNQKNASAIFLGQINWGHFSSPDMLHWTEEKPALTPDKEYDKNGIWSGYAVINDEGIPQLIYTAGGDKMGVGIAFPKDNNLIEWEKYKDNPVIKEKPAKYERTDMRDQYVWKEGNQWYMIIGFGVGKDENAHGALLLYKSEDLKKWEYVHLLFEGKPAIDNSGIFWEMPIFKKIGDKYVLMVNRIPNKGIPARTQYWVGKFENEKFIPNNPVPRNLEVINRLLSPSVIETPDGIISAIAIIPDEIGTEANYKQGWAHLYSIPRVWTLKEDGKIAQSPHPVLKQLRNSCKLYKEKVIGKDNNYKINETGHQLEVNVKFYPGDAKKFGVLLCKNADDSERSYIYFDLSTKELVIDQTQSSLRKSIPLKIRKDFYELKAGKPIELHLFIDGSVIEGFINNEDAFTTRIFPLKENSSQIELFSDGTNTKAKAEVWRLKDAKVKMNF